MRHRFFLEDDLIKIGWGGQSTLAAWDAILRWVLKTLDESTTPLHVLMDFTELYELTEDVFQPELAAKLATHAHAGCLMLVSHNPIFVHFVNQHWVQQAHDAFGLRAFLDTTDALSWLR